MLINGFNAAFKNIDASYLKFGYEYTSEIRFLTTSKGVLPHLTYIISTAEPLCTEFKTVVCYVTGDLILIYIQRGKEGMNNIK